jgi:hypothetical protein
MKRCRHRILFRIKMFGSATLEIRNTVSRARGMIFTCKQNFMIVFITVKTAEEINVKP